MNVEVELLVVLRDLDGLVCRARSSQSAFGVAATAGCRRRSPARPSPDTVLRWAATVLVWTRAEQADLGRDRSFERPFLESGRHAAVVEDWLERRVVAERRGGDAQRVHDGSRAAAVTTAFSSAVYSWSPISGRKALTSAGTISAVRCECVSRRSRSSRAALAAAAERRLAQRLTISREADRSPARGVIA